MVGYREDVAYVEVLPAMENWLPQLNRGLAAVMPQAGQTAGATFGSSFGSSAASKVQAASAQMASAMRAVENAAGTLRVAEARLNDLRVSGNATSTQMLAAEERVAAARRNQQGASERLQSTTVALSAAQQEQAKSTAASSKATEGHSVSITGLWTRMVNLSSAIFVAQSAFAGFGMVGRFIGGAIGAARDLNEEVNKTRVVFGDSADQIMAWSRQSATAFGMSQREALAAVGTFGNLFRTIGLSIPVSADMSMRLVQLAADLASFNNADPSDVLEAMRSGLVGEVEPMRRFGVDLTDTALRSYAASQGIGGLGATLTQQQKATLAYGLMLQQTTLAQGDFARTSGELANQQRTLRGEWENTQAALGRFLYGPVTSIVTFVNTWFLPAFEAIGRVLGGVLNWFMDLPGPVQAGIVALTAFHMLSGPLSGFFMTVGRGLQTMVGNILGSVGQMGLLRGGFEGLMGLFGGPWGLAITGVTVGLGFLVQWLTRTDERTKAVKQATQDYTSALNSAQGAIDANVRAAAAKAAQDAGLLDAAQKLNIPLTRVTDAITGQTGAFTAVKAALQAAIDSHTTYQTSAFGLIPVVDDEGKAFQAAMAALSALSGATTEQTGKAGQLAGATGGATTSAAQHTAALKEEQKAAQDAKQQIDLLKLSLDLLTGAHIDVTQAEAAFWAATAAATTATNNMSGSVKTATGDINLETEAGRAAMKALYDIRDADNAWIATMIAQGASTDEVTRKDAALRESFIRTAMQMGFSRAEAERLADAILGIPGERITKITADTGPADSAIGRFLSHWQGMTLTAGTGTWVVRPEAMGGIVAAAFAPGGFMSSRRAEVVPPRTPRIIGDRVTDDEAFIPINRSARSQSIWVETGRRMGMLPMAAGDVIRGATADYYRTGWWTTVIVPVMASISKSFEDALNDMWARNHPPAIPTGLSGISLPSGGNVVAIVQGVASQFGWGSGAQWTALQWIISHESGWRPTAQNPSSTAYGLFQFLNSTWASTGIGKTSDAALQSIAGMRYIQARYGTPVNAMAFWQRNGWYDWGGIWPAHSMGFNRGDRDERVLGPRQDDYWRRFVQVAEHLLEHERGGHGHGRLADTINIHANDHDQGAAIVDKIWHRLRVASRGGVYPTATVFTP